MSGAKYRRFRINPVELVVFSVCAVIFLNSVYHLFYDSWQGFKTTSVKTSAPPTQEVSQVTSQTYKNIDVGCDLQDSRKIQAAKIRLSGPLCFESGKTGRSPASTARELIKTEITNHANKVSATVFTDTNSGKFSTDYIPLNSGENPIHIKFVYNGGKVVSHELTVFRQ